MATDPALMPSEGAPDAFGEVYDRGYQRYEGPRPGRKHAFWALTSYSMRRALGSKKSWTAKVVPTLMYVAAGLMIAIALGIRAFLDEAEIISYWDYFGLIFVILTVFVAGIAPEMLCNDRHENVLPLYFARAITRLDYLLAKLLGTTILTLTITLIPTFVYWLGRQLLDDSPLTAMKDNADDLGRIIVMSVLTAVYLSAIALMLSSLTGRRSVAVAGIIVAFLVIPVITFGIADSVSSPEIARAVLMLNPIAVVELLSTGIFNQMADSNQYWVTVPLWEIVGAILVTIAICCGVMYWRYVPTD